MGGGGQNKLTTEYQPFTNVRVSLNKMTYYLLVTNTQHVQKIMSFSRNYIILSLKLPPVLRFDINLRMTLIYFDVNILK